MKLVLDMTEYSVHGEKEALNVSLAQYEPLMLVAAAMATCSLLSIATSAVNSAVLVLSDDGLKSTLTMIAFRFIKYIGGNKSEGHFSLVNEAYSIFSHTNPLHPDVFPSIPQFEAEVVAMTAAMLGNKTKSSGGQVCGNITPGGTESILMAVKSTWDFMKATRGISAPEM
ncbi:unnamed protein product [Sphagnum balticum]